MTRDEAERVQRYLREKFGNRAIHLRTGAHKDGTMEVHLDTEFIGVLYRDEDEGELSFHFEMAILEMDLPAEGA